MHDGKEPGPPRPVGAVLLRVGEQVPTLGWPRVEAGGGTRPDPQSVELYVCQQIGKVDVGARVLDDDVGGRLRLIFSTAGMIVAASDPGESRGMTLVLLRNQAEPDVAVS